MKKEKIFWAVALLLSLIVIVFCIVYFIKGCSDNKPQDIQSEEIKTEQVSSATESAQSEEIEVPVNFEELQAQNEDIYAWISLPNANINYPILRSKTERDYYLTHNVDKQKSVYGAIYTEDYNNTDFSDFNTVIYGHNMKNGTMFGSVKRFRDKAFFEENQYIEIYQPDRILKYRIFAAYTFDDRHILNNFKFDTGEDRKAYLDLVYSYKSIRNFIREDVTVTPDDKIITLSTCTSKEKERYLVQAVLVYDSQNK